MFWIKIYNLLKASTTMNITLLNGASIFVFCSSSPKTAIPGKMGLYGKKPIANTMTAIGRSKFARTSNKVDDENLMIG